MLKNIKLFENFIILNESESYNDYPEGAVKNAKKAIRWKKEHGDEVKAGTKVGWQRAHQLSKREKISKSTIKRMKSFFDRHDGNQKIDSKYKSEPWKDNGYVSWLLWGGDESYSWSKKMVRKFKKDE